MLVHWNFSAEQLIAVAANKLLLLIDELVRVRRLGQHVISISRPTALWLLENLQLSEFQIVQLQSIARDYTQTGNLRRQASKYIEISSFSHDCECEDGREIGVSINLIITSNILGPPKIILENIDNDGWMIDFILRNLRELSSIPITRMHKLHGGGGDVIRVLNYEIAERSIVCAIMDSDKTHPDAADGDKVLAAEEACREANWPLAFIRQTPCHEIESFIPFELVADLAHNDNSLGISRIWKIIENEKATDCADRDSYWRWFDIKRGVSNEILDLMPAQQKAWHTSKLDLIGATPGIREIRGFGANLVPRIMRENRNHGLLAKGLNDKAWPDEYKAWFGDLSWIFIAQRPIFT